MPMMTPKFSLEQIAFLTELAAASLAADDVFPVIDTSAGTAKKIQAQNLLDGLLRVYPSATLNLRPAVGSVTGGGGLTPEVSIPIAGAGNHLSLSIGRVDKAFPAFEFNQDGNDEHFFALWDKIGQNVTRIQTRAGEGSGLRMAVGSNLGWSNNSDLTASITLRTGLAYGADKVLKIVQDVGGNLGWFHHIGFLRLASDATNATATMSSLSNLSVAVEAGRKYTGRMVLFVNDSVAADGIAIDFDGGTATMTSFRAHCRILDAGLLTSAQSSALATDFTAATVTGDALVEVDFGFVVNAAGTFIPRFAQAAHTTGTATAYTNSWMKIDDMP